ncbi:DMT family transporter [Brevundimonas sp. NPDC090276]|uniref:DMT family transporter n=1 Tax=Brevundimonas sp. NPDC090276 TaxID=3363956 RepID=UPI003839F968
MNPSWIVMLLVMLAGGATALQAPTNARLASAVASPVNAAFVSFLVGTAALGLLALTLQTRPDAAAMKALPWWVWIGGLYGAIFVVTAAWSVPRLGVAMTVILMVAGQILISVLLDHFGALGVPKQPLNLTRLLGVLLVFGGVLLVRRG